jgi:transposase InsO family protein
VATWYYQPARSDVDARRRQRAIIPTHIEQAVVSMADANPWHGYKRIAVMCRRAGASVTDRQAYSVMRAHDLLRKRRRPRAAALYQASKLYELLPTSPNQLWQMDVTYVHIPGHGWWYAVTVIDYYSRFLLALRLTWSYSASEVIAALEEGRAAAEAITGPLARQPFLVTDNGSSFMARAFGHYVRYGFAHVRIQYRMPTQLGLLERFHQTSKDEEAYWRLYDGPQPARECFAEFHHRYNHVRPHWALRPEEGGDPSVPTDVYVRGRPIQPSRWQPWAREVKRRLEELLVLSA